MNLDTKVRPRWLRAAAAILGAAALASCGGGSSQKEAFVASRLVAFGDETSALTASGRKYSVNALDTSGQIDCSANPIWIQSVAAIYGFGFAECNADPSVTPKARTFATDGAVVADVSAQVEAQVAAGGVRDGDIATVLAGTNDILALYRRYPASSEAELTLEARARGRQLADVVNRLVGFGVKVLISDLPDVGLTPYAINQRAQFTDIDRAALLSRLTSAFNEQLGVNVVLDGRFVGLVQSQQRFQAINRSPVSFGLSNVTEGICTVTVLNCTTATLVTDAVAEQYLWADDTRLAPGGHSQLASLAVDRAPAQSVLADPTLAPWRVWTRCRSRHACWLSTPPPKVWRSPFTMALRRSASRPTVARRPRGSCCRSCMPCCGRRGSYSRSSTASPSAAVPAPSRGLRTACSVAQGLALGLRLPLMPIDSLLIVAEDARAQLVGANGDTPFDVAVVMDARMNESYAARYRHADGRWETVLAPLLLGRDALVERLRAASPPVVAGSAITPLDLLRSLPPGTITVAVERDRAAALLRLARLACAAGATVDAAEGLPLYLRDKVAQTTAERDLAKAAAAAA